MEFLTLRMCNAEISCCFESIRLRIQLSRSMILSSERSSEATASGSGRSSDVRNFFENEDKDNIAGNDEVGVTMVADGVAGEGKCDASFAFLLNANFEVVEEAFRRSSRVFSSACNCYPDRSASAHLGGESLTVSQFL